MIGAIVGVVVSVLRTKAYDTMYDKAKGFIVRKVADYV